MVFPVVVYGCESWTMKKAEHWRIDAFELWCWRRLLRVPWTARRSNQSMLKEISPGISLQGMMLKLKLQYFGHLMRKVDSLEKTLMLGRIRGMRSKGKTEDEMAGWHYQLNGCECEWTPGVGNGQGGLACCNSWGCKESDTTERLNWTENKTQRATGQGYVLASEKPEKNPGIFDPRVHIFNKQTLPTEVGIHWCPPPPSLHSLLFKIYFLNTYQGLSNILWLKNQMWLN